MTIRDDPVVHCEADVRCLRSVGEWGFLIVSRAS